MAIRSLAFPFTILFLVNILFFLAVIFESPGEENIRGQILLTVSSREFVGAQLFGSAVVEVGQTNQSTVNDLEELYSHTLQFGKLDDTGTYLILSHVITALDQKTFANDVLCVGVQASVDQLHKLPEFVATWPGAISLAVFAPGVEFFLAIAYVHHLRTCFPQIKSQVTWHFAFPTEVRGNASDASLAREISAGRCDELGPKEVLERLLQTQGTEEAQQVLKNKRSNHEMPYPQNLMRNVARQHCLSEWVVCPDIDMLFPRPNPQMEPSLAAGLSEFLRSPEATDCGKCAFVLPLYELEHPNRTLPGDKDELLAFVARGWAQQYHKEVFAQNQAASQLQKWQKRAEKRRVRLAYKVSFQMWYEPIYVARQGSPKFDERYVGYGMTRNTQAYEMSLAGYSFHLLDSIFLSHVWGLKRKTAVESNTERKIETQMNTRFFSSVHVRELAARYDSDRHNILRYQKRSNKNYNIVMNTRAPEIKSIKSSGKYTNVI
ncbi:beta-1,4-glucuronyltransferase 1-like [Neocloeon triangulifer]|uniref:beta-1,4-glucuronyltransferase 1-like n=1 Tax=Neocloeon triangulifer TaxID=2078957 RepID=UPI00286EEB0D|nr:beta-1,4-glucuronyltransferase 1-like [Neocloeon triangulifer]XP_059481229.1 beta-1,4-glucuronyltransferase 1-like [Neocloeon triangulifer]